MPSEQEYTRKLFRENPGLKEKLCEMRDAGILHSAAEVSDTDAPYVVGGPDPRGIVGSKQYRCSCGAAVWISPSTQEMMQRVPAAKVSCMTCALAMVEAAKENKQ